MTAPTISPLPAPPSRSTDPTNFAIEADAFVAALPAFGTQANAQADYLDALALAVDGDAVSAASSAANAEGFADDAAASAAGSAAAADVNAWVSGTTYTIGTCVFSPIDFQTYRRKTSGAGATDPSADIANWVVITGAGGGGKITAVATGALSNGTKVVLNSNGTVSAVSKTITALNPPTSSAISAGSYPTNYLTAYDKNRKLVFVASQTTGGGTIVSIGQVFNNAIVFSGNTSLYTTGARFDLALAYDDRTEQLIVAYAPADDTFGYVAVGPVFFHPSGYWAVAFGTITAFNSSSNTGHLALAVNTDNSTVLIGYQSNNPLLVKVGTLGFRSISFGTAATVISSGQGTGLCYIGNNNFAVTYRSLTGTTGLNAAVVSISGTTATVNTAINLSGAGSVHPALCACDISAQRLVTTYVNFTGNTGLAFVASINGTTLTAGNSVTVVANSASHKVGVSFNPDTGRFVFAYINNADSTRLYAASGLITGTNIALGTAGVVSSTLSSSSSPFAIFRSDVGDTIISAFSANTGTVGFVFTASATITANLTTDNFIGISDGAYTNGANATIQVISSVDDAQVGLTAGRRYFVSEDGSLKLQSGDWEPVVYAGIAVNSTSLLIKG